ncbi:MAG: right-handed parallel beta-helix repeat-containing protein [Thermoleophilia bacterium]|nr:right-handed parallel beta-helix repeat-containing protein [Thermoleophilia bacterium]
MRQSGSTRRPIVPYTRSSLRGSRAARAVATTTALVAFALVALLVPASPASAFPDVPNDHPYAQAINGLSQMGIVGGYTDGRFGLNDTVKRAQFAKMIVGALGIDPGTATVTRFTDLGSPDANGYPHKYVQAAYDNGITKGTNTAQTLFSPGSPIRRDQVITMIVRAALAESSSALADPRAGAATAFAGVGKPHGNNVRIAEFNGLLRGLVGVDQGWDVTANATRGEVAQMLWNLIPGDFTVLVDGTGDYPTIEDAVANVGPRDWIHLGPGTFTLKGTLTVHHPLRLVGVGAEGAQTTTVRYPGTLIEAESTLVAVARVRLLSTSTSIASSVVRASDSMVILEDCDLSGAHRADEKGGSGLRLSATSGGIVSHCSLYENDLNGVEVGDKASVVVQECDCSNNGQGGVVFFDDATGVVRDCTCSSNGYHGISVQDRAEVTVEDNRCTDNVQSGVAFFGESSGTVQGNECTGNKLGLYIDTNATPSVGTNVLRGNTTDYYKK